MLLVVMGVCPRVCTADITIDYCLADMVHTWISHNTHNQSRLIFDVPPPPVGSTHCVATQTHAGILRKVIDIIYDSVKNVIIRVCWIISILTTFGCFGIQIQLLGVLDLDPVRMVMGIGEKFTKLAPSCQRR
jgi:hypothetical protein